MSNVEEKLAETGKAGEDAEFVQWLPKVDGSSWPLHARVLAANHYPGVNLVDHPIMEWDDPRVSYVSLLDDTLVISVQYSGAVSTLGRLASTVFADKLWRKVLTKDRLWGEEGGVGLESEVTRELVREASQIGYLGEDVSYEDFREQIKAARNELRATLTEASGSKSAQSRKALRTAHGLLTSATHLYNLLNIDVVIELRNPDPNRTRDQDLLDFLTRTIPKQATYSGHSFYRHVYESDGEKRQQTKSLAEERHRQATLTASWVFTGPQITQYEDRIRRNLRAFDGSHRQDDREDFSSMELTVTVADSWSDDGIRGAIRTVLERKALSPNPESIEMQNLVGLFRGLTGSVYDVADALTQLDKSVTDDLSYLDAKSALASLPSERLLPDHQPTVGALLRVLLVANEPLTGTELIDHPEYTRSARSYYGNKDELAAFGLAEETDEGWVSRLDEFWDDSEDDLHPMRASRVIMDGLYALDEDPQHEKFGWPVQFDELVPDGDTHEPWVETIRSLCWVHPEDEGREVVLGTDRPQTELDQYRNSMTGS